MPVVETPNVSATDTSAPDVAAPSVTSDLIVLPIFTATATIPVPTLLPTVAPPTTAPPAPYPAPATQALQSADNQPTATQPAPTATPTPVITLNPRAEFGDPKYRNRMEFPILGEWAQAETAALPDDDNIRLEFKEGKLYVTGKQLGFSTWWFSYHTLRDAYVEMTFDTRDCSGGDAYGIIFRGPPHLAGESHGYVAAFTCEGDVWVWRLDGVDPWETKDLVDEHENSAIKKGSNQQNVIGVQSKGDHFTIFANGVQVADVIDDEFEQGRVGVFVRSAGLNAYTYRVLDFAYWLVDEQ